jgi:DNA adenine methylase
MKPIIKWSGGKRDEYKYIKEHIPEFSLYIEPFIGGGAIFFELNPKKAVIADVHPDLIALYKTIASGNSNKMIEFMDKTPNEEATYYKIRNEMETPTDLDKACKFYYERKTCYRGMLRYNKKGKFNIPFGKYKTLNYSDLKNKDYETLLKRTEIFLEPFEVIFEKYNDENNFMFLDPPYDSVFTDYGYCSFTKEHHKKLAECFKKTKNKCLMIIGKTDFIVELYKDYIVEEFGKKYAFKLHSGRIGNEINTTHLIIKNY